MSRHAILPFVRRLKIIDKESRTVTLGRVLNPPQLRLIDSVEQDVRDGRPIRYITLKARQVGISTVTEAMAFQFAICMNRSRGLIVSHTGDSTKHLMDMSHHYWDSFWAAPLYKTTSSARDRLAWDPTKSSISLLPAKSLEGARSRTLHFVHASEAAFWPHPRELMKGLSQGVPRVALSAIFVESTANGVGNWFHETWEAAKRGDVEYKPMFFPWWTHPEYNAHHIGRGDEARKLLLAKTSSGGTLDDEEWHLYRGLVQRGMGEGEIQSRLVWRRLTLATELSGSLDDFHQEYPSTDDEAFLSTGRNVFDLTQLRAAYAPLIPARGKLVRDARARSGVTFVDDPAGPLHVYQFPSERTPGSYVVGIDNSKAARFGDFAVAQVLDRRTMAHCATWRDRGHKDLDFGEQMILLGHWYDEAMLAPEYNFNGAVISGILQARYKNLYVHRKAGKIRGLHDDVFGWPMTDQTKYEAMDHLKKEVWLASQSQSDFRIKDQDTYQEMKNYIINDAGRFENSKQAQHDDTVTSMAIAVSVAVLERANLPVVPGAMGGTDPAVMAGMREVRELQDGLDLAPVSKRRDDGSHGLVLPPTVSPFGPRQGDGDMFGDGKWEW